MQSKRNKRNAACAIATALILAFSALPVAGQAQQQAPDLSNSKIEAVAEAYLKVFEIQNTYRPQIEAAQNPEQAQRLQQQANDETVKIIREQEGLTVEEYSQVINLAQSNEQVRERLVKEIERIQQEEEDPDSDRR